MTVKKNENGVAYVSPEMKSIAICSESVICASYRSCGIDDFATAEGAWN